MLSLYVVMLANTLLDDCQQYKLFLQAAHNLRLRKLKW